MATAMEGDRKQAEDTDQMQAEGGARHEVTHSASSEADFFNRLHRAVSARAEYIKENAESLTMLEFRRLLEQDLGMEKSSLDPQKKRIKQLVDEVLAVAEVEPEATTEKATQKEINEELIRDAIFKRSEYLQSQSENLSFKEVRRLLEKDLGLEEFSFDSKKTIIDHILVEVIGNKDTGALPEEKQTGKTQTRAKPARKKAQVFEESDEEEPEEMEQTKAKTRKKKPQVVDESEEEGSEPKKQTETKRKAQAVHESDEEGSQQKQSKARPRKKKTQTVDESDEEESKEKQSKVSSDEKTPQVIDESDTGGSEEQKQTKVEEEGSEDDSSENPQKRMKAKADRRKKQESDEEGSDEKVIEKTPPKKRRKAKAGKNIGSTQTEEEVSEEKETDSSEKKRKKRKSDEQEADASDSSDKRPSKKASKAPAAKPVQSKTVEHLKHMIKSCGMNIPPSTYRKVKQTSEDKREKALIKELEAILQKEGLNRNSSEKEIKAVKRRKDKQKDLEGIDLGNIISESRGSRRQNFYDFPFEKKSKKMVISDDEESNDDESD